jgi:TM2 domain-containing membrane protein YozV
VKVTLKNGGLEVMPSKSPVLAAILSLILPGLGQFYVNDIGKGIMFIILDLIGWGLNSSVVGLVVGIPLLLVIGIWSIVAAYNAAKLTVG